MFISTIWAKELHAAVKLKFFLLGYMHSASLVQQTGLLSPIPEDGLKSSVDFVANRAF